MEQFENWIVNFFKNFGTRVLEAVAVLLLGIVIIRLLTRFIRAVLHRSKFEGTAGSFIMSIVNAALVLILFFIILNIFNIDTSSAVSIIAASGLAVGLALQDSLSNVASGIILLFTKPFKENDSVAIGSVEGKVNKIKITTTEILTFDNVTITVPNSKVVTSDITNFNARPTRRFDVIVSAGLDSDIDTVKAVLQKIADDDERVLKNPESSVIVVSVTASSVDYRLRGWCMNENYWDIKNSYFEYILKAFRESGIAVPSGTLNVRLDGKTSEEVETDA